MKIRQAILPCLIFVFGVGAGGYEFAHTQPRSVLVLNKCNGTCYQKKELAGLVTSAGIQRLPGFIPNVVVESDRCVVMVHPHPETRHHYVMFPKHDVKNIVELTAEDQPFVMGCFALIPDLIAKSGTRDYRILRNGPGYQEFAYLHFHFMGK